MSFETFMVDIHEGELRPKVVDIAKRSRMSKENFMT